MLKGKYAVLIGNTLQVVDVVREQLNLVFKSEKKISNTEQFR